MRISLLAIVLFCFSICASAQGVEEYYPKTLWCASDTFYLKFKDFPKLFPYRVSREDKVSPGEDAKPDNYATLYYGKDSLRLTYHNKIPYAHNFYINFESPKGKTTFRFHFNDIPCLFSPAYMDKNRGNVQVEMPEVYELANIIWTLSPSGSRARDLNNHGVYYDRVVKYFKPYLHHPIFKSLDFPDSLYADRYYDFRENSFAFNFAEPRTGSTNTQLLYNGPYYYVYGKELADSSWFGKLKPLVEDFARKSKFRAFYKANLSYYQQQIQRQEQLLPTQQMWSWLEEQFPKEKHQSYKIVFSSLIGGSHSTQRYSTHYKGAWFTENVMFVCGTDGVDQMQNITEKQKEGLMSGVVFTEIDHNYVNPSTNKYAQRVDSIFKARKVWVAEGKSGFYGSPVSVFNEYMTHAAFCLYIADVYDDETARFVIDRRERLMVDRRYFIRFKEFDQELLRLRKEQPQVKLVDLYPAILAWCKTQL